MEKAVAKLRAIVAEMKRETVERNTTLGTIDELLGDYIKGFETLVTANFVLRILLRNETAQKARKGYSRKKIREIERLLDRNSDFTDDWIEPDGLIAEAMDALVRASMKYGELSKHPPPKRR